MTRIKKIPGAYPATIAQAVKDANFKKSGGAVMTQSEINKDFKDGISSSVKSQDLSYRILLQLCAYYLIPEWTHKEGGYKKDEVVRCQGRLFQAKADTTTSPYIAIDDGNGNIVVDDNWNVLTTDKVDEENWAHVLGGAPEFNLIQQIANLREENAQLKARIGQIEQFLSTHTLITE